MTSCRTPIIQTNHARGRLSRLFPETNQTQDGIATSADAELASGVGSGLTSDSESKLTEGFLQPVGAAPRKDDRALGVEEPKIF